MQESGELIAQKADGAGEVAGFLDCTGLQICKPSGSRRLDLAAPPGPTLTI